MHRVDGFAILFQPSALRLLFALPAQEFTDKDFDAEQVFGPLIAHFQERLADCRTFDERISVANQFLLRRALAAPRRDGISEAATDIIRRAGGARIPTMAGRAGLGLRQFERRFVQQVGVSPKLFARVARFEAALDRMARSPQGSWTEVAHRFGYYDQMHMVHDFSRFTGETPTRTLQHFENAFERQMMASDPDTPRGLKASDGSSKAVPCLLLALSWLDPPCAPKAAIGICKRTLGDLTSLPRQRGSARSSGLGPAPILASEHAGDARWCLAGGGAPSRIKAQGR
jgi:AraC-like DNA-binding protein